MKNLLHRINNKGLPVVTDIVPIPETANVMALGRALYLSLLACILSLTVAVISKLITWIVDAVTALILYINGISSSTAAEPGAWIIITLVAGALLFVFVLKYHAIFLKPLAMAVGIGAGAPLGIESPVMLAGGVLGASVGKLLRCSAAECHILFVATACSGIAFLFGAPLAAILLAVEVLLAEWTLCSVLPVVMAAMVGMSAGFFFRGTGPVFSITDGPTVNILAVVAYTLSGLFIGLLSVCIIKLSELVHNWFTKLTAYSPYIILAGALLAGITGYFAPPALGTGKGYINDLLHAHVTLSLLFTLCIMKLIAWIFFTGANNTGSGITPVLIIGGATGLLIGVVVQIIFPVVVINSGMVVLIGMGAMFASTSRALLAAIFFVAETTHCLEAVWPLSISCIAAYSVSLLFIKNNMQ